MNFEVLRVQELTRPSVEDHPLPMAGDILLVESLASLMLWHAQEDVVRSSGGKFVPLFVLVTSYSRVLHGYYRTRPQVNTLLDDMSDSAIL